MFFYICKYVFKLTQCSFITKNDMMRKYIFPFLLATIFLNACENKEETAAINTILWSKASRIKSSDLLTNASFISLETTEKSIIGSISHLIIFNERIYILDTYKQQALFVFSINGQFIQKVGKVGRGPGEFLSPDSFWINDDGIFILDRALSQILRYDLSDYTYVETIVTPDLAPLSFCVFPGCEQFIYYFPNRTENKLNDMQFVLADKKGNIHQLYYESTPSSKILHGNPHNFYISMKDNKSDKAFHFRSNDLNDDLGLGLSEFPYPISKCSGREFYRCYSSL